MKTRVFKTDWFAGFLITFIFLIISSSGFFASIERDAYDFGVKSSTRTTNDKIAIIAIDDDSISNIGRFPWSRDIHARMYEILSKGGAKVIGQTVFFPESQVDPGLELLREIKNTFTHSNIPTAVEQIKKISTTIKDSHRLVKKKRDANGRIAVQKIADALNHSSLQQQLDADVKKVVQQFEAAEQLLDTDHTLAESIGLAGNIVFNLPAIHGTPYGSPDDILPKYITINKLLKKNITNGSSFFTDPSAALSVVDLIFPIAVLGEQASAFGATVATLDVDGSIRTEPLIVNYYDDYYPSMALVLAAKGLNLDINDIKVNVGSQVSLGRLAINTNEYSMMNTFFYHGKENTKVFPVDSFFDVLHGNIPADKYKNKIVLIGPTALGIGDTFSTPTDTAMSPVVILAHTVSSILNEDFFIEPEWGFIAQIAIIAFIALYLMFLLPKLGAIFSFSITTIFLIVMFFTHYTMMTEHGIWLQLMTPILLLIAGHALLTTKNLFSSERGKAKLNIESAENNRMLGLSLQGQGQLDIAFEKFRKLPLENATLELLYNLALDYERKRQFSKARSVYNYMSDFNVAFRDIKKRAARAQSLEENVLLSSNGQSSVGDTLMLGNSDVEKPMLGRYKVVSTLGKGSMGAVYLGMDPKISRPVAIKTMALSQEFTDDKLIEVRERFFREAKTAGRLTHPNIVTIYDAGEEHDLAYIAMELLKGNDLSHYVKKGSLLPISQVLSIIKRAADSLDYAHQHNVVHRDIKPANIMWDKETDSLKLTDFGIARITDASQTKTGTILGTPAYMSPEQLSGKKVTGQSDIFSLGIMLFQMVTGKLPFSADTMAAVMYKIGNEPHPKPESINPKVPKCIVTIINRAMEKDVNKRYNRASAMVADINKCLRILKAEGKI